MDYDYREPLHILLVEDNPGDVRLIQENLKEIPLRTQLSVVEDGELALAFLRRQGPYTAAPRPDFILLDLHLPRKNGDEVLAEIQSDPTLNEIPVAVCLATAADKPDLARHRLSDACVFVKGFAPDQLLHTLTHCPETTIGTR
jgi:two-component system, chemotaxis family, response regulator Rcp1